MKKPSFLSIIVIALMLACGISPAWSADQTINIMCWEGYADAAVVDAFKAVVKAKYNINVDVKASYATGQEDFFKAAKDGTADLISPPADMPKTPRFNCFEKGNLFLSEIDTQGLPNLEYLLPFFKDDQSLINDGKRYGVPYNCGPYGLAYNTAVVKTAPTSWNVFWDPAHAGKYTINNNFHKCNIWITALSLGYPYDHLFDIKKMDRIKIQEKLNVLAKNAKSLWDGEADANEFPGLDLATTWGFSVVKANQAGGAWKLALPKEGGSAWIDYWCITHAATGEKKKLCQEWINLQLTPKFQAAVVKQQGVSPVVSNVGALVTPEEEVLFNVGNNDYFNTVAIWQVMSEETEKAFEEMWEEAKSLRK